MDKISIFWEIRKRYGREYMLRQLAEECCELGQATLKVIRAWRDETPMKECIARQELAEEIADVRVMLEAVSETIMNGDERMLATMFEEYKIERMEKRMLGGDQSENKGRAAGEVCGVSES